MRRVSDALESSLARMSRRIVKSPRARDDRGDVSFRWMIANRLAPTSRIFST